MESKSIMDLLALRLLQDATDIHFDMLQHVGPFEVCKAPRCKHDRETVRAAKGELN